MRLKNKVAIVTGGASGIGAATCRLYAQEGAAGIVVADINEEGGQSVANNIVEAGGEAIFIHLDVSVE
ncbi:MAG TPA: SDR family NAD(P)-dependent oxidoreductase, partial [Gammaproteobacteria bacterium]|nr:SDR family NAD(P)-dependent oxidoreductase [Gammaproteobacteria bacterium]